MRGQVSMEFIMVMSLAVIMLLGLLSVGAFELRRSADDARETRVIDIAQTIQQELATAYAVRDGYRRTFSIPPTLEKQQYYILKQNGTAVQVITVQFRTKSHSVRTPLCVGSIVPGTNTIRTEGGVLYCN